MVEKVKVFYSDDESLKEFGELLTNKTSRSIIRLLWSGKEYYTNEIALTLDMSVSLVIHHLKKIKKLNLVTESSKQITKNTKDHTFYRMRTDIFLSKHSKDEAEKKGSLKRIFRDGVKFTSVSIVFVIGLFFINSMTYGAYVSKKIKYEFNDSTLIICILLIVIAIMIFERIFGCRFRKKNKD